MNCQKNIQRLESIGVFFSILLGILFHFTFDLAGRTCFAAIFSAVNESTWEHMKLLFFPYLFFMILEYVFIRNKECIPNFLTAKAAGTLAGLLAIPILYYGYSAIIQKDVVWLNILIFIASVIIAYRTSYKLLLNPDIVYNGLGLSYLVIMTFAFIFFTFYPPDTKLFFSPAFTCPNWW